jgi:uncharacterized lipoprotein YddW (UPF0748 family)
MFIRPLLSLVAALCVAATLTAQIRPNPPIAEMRGAWIATLANIDWPSASNLSVPQQQAQFDSILSVLKSMGMNAVFVQIRPAADAFYPSNLAPWSRYLTGKQGVAPAGNYDPLDYMIKATHARRMEFHAWLNPYRATVDLDTANLAPTHPLRALPADRKAQWFFRYGNRYYFNPANSLVIRHLDGVVKEIVNKYDVDGIHFDDYFYPYKEAGWELNDYDAFARDPRGFTNINDWRRDNVNRLIETVSKTVHSSKPWVRFGISPFGVWRNNDKDPNGSATRAGMTCYDDLYADILLWLQKGWIDYVAPQIYWSIGFPPADYRTLVDWWSQHTYGRQLYIGHAVYKAGNGEQYKDPNWNYPDQIKRQVELNRISPNVQGSIYYSTRQLLRNPYGIQDTLGQNLYKNLALSPPVTGVSRILPQTVQWCKPMSNQTSDSLLLTWNMCQVLTGEEMPYYFAIYRFNGDEGGDYNDPKNLLAITPYAQEETEWKFADQDVRNGEYYTYTIVSYNRLNIASTPSEPISIKKVNNSIKLKRPLVGYLFRVKRTTGSKK